MTNNEVRELLKKADINKDNVTYGQIYRLWILIDIEMKESLHYNGEYGMNKLPEFNLKSNNHLFMTCHSDQWDNREAVSFNRDGFIGFAGWADTKHTAPILKAVCFWIEEICDAK